MIRVKEISLTRAEGYVRECVTEKATSFRQANLILYRWGRTAPPRGHGYHKCHFVVTYEDGNTYDGRFDLNSGFVPSLERHMRDHCEASSGRWTPPHRTAEQWASYLRDVLGAEKQEAYAKFLDAFQIGDITP